MVVNQEKLEGRARQSSANLSARPGRRLTWRIDMAAQRQESWLSFRALWEALDLDSLLRE